MAIPQPFKRTIKEELERLIRLNTDGQGQVDLAQVKVAFGAYLIAHPDYLDAQRQANAQVDDWDRARRPKDDPSGQRSMFDEGAFFPNGENTRKQMGKAIRDDLTAWAAISLDEIAVSAAAHARRMRYISSRTAAWQPHHKTLLDVEHDQFPPASA